MLSDNCRWNNGSLGLNTDLDTADQHPLFHVFPSFKLRVELESVRNFLGLSLSTGRV